MQAGTKEDWKTIIDEQEELIRRLEPIEEECKISLPEILFNFDEDQTPYAINYPNKPSLITDLETLRSQKSSDPNNDKHQISKKDILSLIKQDIMNYKVLKANEKKHKEHDFNNQKTNFSNSKTDFSKSNLVFTDVQKDIIRYWLELAREELSRKDFINRIDLKNADKVEILKTKQKDYNFKINLHLFIKLKDYLLNLKTISIKLTTLLTKI